MHDTGTLTSGEFGRLAGLSAKALRLYETSGLLSPASIAPGSNYRRYHRDQLERACRIALLRQAGMPLAVIAEALAAAEDGAFERIDAWWAAEESAMFARRRSVQWLRQSLSGDPESTADYVITTRDVADRKIATMRVETDLAGLVDAMHGAEWRIRDLLARQRATRTAERWVIHFGMVTPDGESSIEVCVPFTGSVEPAGAIAIRMEPAHREAYTTVARDDCFYPRILRAYDALDRAVAVPTGPMREIYVADWAAIKGTDPFVEVVQPMEA